MGTYNVGKKGKSREGGDKGVESPGSPPPVATSAGFRFLLARNGAWRDNVSNSRGCWGNPSLGGHGPFPEQRENGTRCWPPAPIWARMKSWRRLGREGWERFTAAAVRGWGGGGARRVCPRPRPPTPRR